MQLGDEEYDSIQSLLFGIRKLLPVTLEDGRNKRDGGVEIHFDANAGLTFPTKIIPNLLCFRGKKTPFGIYIGNEGLSTPRTLVADYPYDFPPE